MPKRPRSHITGEESVKALLAALPPHWIPRVEEKDYGIDGSVEIVANTPTGEVSGLRFYFQIKGAEQENLKNSLRLRLKSDNVRYYHKTKLPILLVRYTSKDNALYTRWFHRTPLFGTNPKTKTASFTFKESDRWTSKTPNSIIREIDNYWWLKQPHLIAPIKFLLNLDDLDIPTEWKRGMVIDLEATGRSLNIPIIFTEVQSDQSRGEIYFGAKEIEIFLPAGQTVVIPYEAKSLRRRPDKSLIPTIMTGIGMGFYIAKHYNIAADLFTNNIADARFGLEEEIISAVVKTFVVRQEILPGLQLANSLQEHCPDKRSLATVLVISLISMSSNHVLSAERIAICQELQRYIEITRSIKDDQKFAVTLHNTASLLRQGGLSYVQAIKYHNEAAKLNPTYRDTPSFWTEIGETLFKAKHFKWSSKAYEKALELGAPEDVILEHAKALMYSGQYHLASMRLKAYIKTPDVDEYWNFVSAAIDFMLDNFNILRQDRNIVRAKALAESLSTQKKLRGDMALKILKLDLLNSVAWLEIGVAEARNERKNKAFYCFALSAIFEERNIIAWSNAFFTAINNKKLADWGRLALSRGLKVHGELLYMNIISQYSKFSSKDSAQNLSAILKDCLHKIQAHQEAERINIFDPNSFTFVKVDPSFSEATPHTPPAKSPTA